MAGFSFNLDKAIAAITFLSAQGIPDLTKGKVAKLLFLSDKQHLVRHARPITGDWYAAVEHGPIPSNIDNLLDAFEVRNLEYPGVSHLAECIELDYRFQYPRFHGRMPADFARQFLSETDIESLSEILKRFRDKTFSELRSITHEIPAYEKAWATRSGNRGTMNFVDFFEDDEDAISGIRDEIIENCALWAAFPEPSF